MSNESIITNNLSIGYGATIVQSSLSLVLKAGEMVCMLGPNGCGKSTLLRTLAGLQPALGGSFTLPSLHTQLNRDIALVLTERLSIDHATVHDVVALGRYPYTSFLDGLTDEDEQTILHSLRAVGFGPNEKAITNLSASFFNDHSDGEKQQILIAKALAQQTPIILLDEPTAHLDLPHRILILRLLRRLAHEQNKTIVISTHELELALALSDRILLLSPTGQGAQLDSAEQLRKTDAFTRVFGMDIFTPLTK